MRIAAAYYAAFMLLGLMLTSIGPALDALQKQTGSTAGSISLLFTATALGYMAGSLTGGRLYGRLEGNRVIAGALVCLAAITFTVPLGESLWLLITVFVLIGTCLGVMDVGGNTLMVWLYRSDVPPYMSALHLSFGVGAFVGPLVLDRVAVITGDAVNTYWLYAGLMIPVAAWVMMMPSPRSPVAAAGGAGGPSPVRRHAVMIGLIALFFFLHIGSQAVFGGWIYSYSREFIGSETTARMVNSAFWGGLVLGRIIAIPLALRMTPRAMLEINLAGCVAAIGVMILLPASTPILWIGTIGFGMAVASMIPASINLAARRMPITGQVTALFLVGGSLGSMTLPWLVGQLFEPRGRASLLYVTGAAVVAAVMVYAALRARAGDRTGESGGVRT
jgi:FHS family Na+ dependent glucose MFS transporter 1